MTRRTIPIIDVPELSTIEPTETLSQWHARVHPRRPSIRARVVRALASTLTTFR